MDWKCSYALDLSCPNRQRLEVSKNVKYIDVTSRASKLQVSKVQELWDLNPLLPSLFPYVWWLTREAWVQILAWLNFEVLEVTELYIFGNLQSLSIWTSEVKSVAAFSVHDILSGMYLHHKIENICKHSKETVIDFIAVIWTIQSWYF